MSATAQVTILEAILATIDIPESAYEAAEQRYKDLGAWLCRKESHSGAFNPHIGPQGSFRLGTVTRPITEAETYDLDLVCNLRDGLSKDLITQRRLKHLVGLDIESYRVARHIQKPKEEKHRCWCVEYADGLQFHMDVLPCLPEQAEKRIKMEEAMIQAGAELAFARSVANLALSITDDRHHSYSQLTWDWFVSNPEGYARWFESRMRLATRFLERRLLEIRAARVDDLPVFRWKTPLQRTVQVLKRHRDHMFADTSDLKPASIIITTLAGHAYQGESDLPLALERCLRDMAGFVKPVWPRIPNPVMPDREDFADCWASPSGRAKRLEENFWRWLEQARSDFRQLNSTDPDFLATQADTKLGVRLNSRELAQKIGVTAPFVTTVPKSHRIIETPARPWRS